MVKMLPASSAAGLSVALRILFLTGIAAACSAVQARNKEHVVYSFTGGNDGAQPLVGLLMDGSGNLYGTANTGGADSAGVVFKVRPAGKETVLCTFTGGNDGANPRGLVLDANGNLIGTTIHGGADNAGVLFKLTPQGAYTVLYTFTGGNDGAQPNPTLSLDGAGNVFGAAAAGGSKGAGVVFEYTTSGSYKVLYTFTGGNDGASPRGIAVDGSGNIYGATFSGGAKAAGVIFKLTPKGKETVLHTFTGGSDGGSPSAGVALDGAGNLYDATDVGGADSAGVVFEVTKKGIFKLLYTFTGGNDGAAPRGGVVLDTLGNLYGPTFFGGADNAGVLFKVTPKGKETVLYAFTGGSDGGQPVGRVVLDSAGDIYGTTVAGGSSNAGTVYEVTN